jgi:GH18 family chitinase
LTELRIAGNTHPQYLPPHDPIIITWPAFWANINFKTVGPWHVTVASLVDQYNLMTYSMAGIWTGWDSWHHAALSDAQPSHPTSIEASINEYVAAGVPKKKLGVGIGFYGLYYSNGPVNAPRQPTGNSKLEGADVENAYMELVKDGAFKQPNGQIKWDSAAKQSYVTYSPPWKRYPQTSVGFLSFEDEQSIAAKGQYIKTNGLGGSMIWTINYGCTNAGNGDNPLLSAAKASLK